MRRTRKHTKERGGGSTDSEDPSLAEIKHPFKKKQPKSQTNQTGKKGKAARKNGEQGQDSKGSEGSRRLAEVEKCQKDKASSAREEQRANSISELPQSNKTSKVHGEYVWAGIIPGRDDRMAEGKSILAS